MYWINPQYSLTVKRPDQSSPTATVLVSLMQKHGRLKRTINKTDNANIPMSFDVYKVSKAASLVDIQACIM